MFSKNEGEGILNDSLFLLLCLPSKDKIIYNILILSGLFYV